MNEKDRLSFERIAKPLFRKLYRKKSEQRNSVTSSILEASFQKLLQQYEDKEEVCTTPV